MIKKIAYFTGYIVLFSNLIVAIVYAFKGNLIKQTFSILLAILLKLFINDIEERQE